MPTAAKLDAEDRFTGIEEVADDATDGRILVPAEIDLPRDGSYYFDFNRGSFLSVRWRVEQERHLRDAAAIEERRGSQVARAALHRRPRTAAAPAEAALPLPPVDPDHAIFLALSALVRGEPVPEEWDRYAAWYEAHARERAERRVAVRRRVPR